MAFLDYTGLQRYTSKFKTWIRNITGNEDMGTVASTITGAVAEHSSHIAALEAVTPVRSVNNETPDSSGNVNISTVDYAYNIASDDAQSSSGTFNVRTTGGSASIADGSAWLTTIKGTSEHKNYVPYSLSFTVTTVEREEGVDPIEVTINEETFVANNSTSGTFVWTYTGGAWGSSSPSSAWSGVTVSGTPLAGDKITISYTAEQRGKIYYSKPYRFVSTGWNLYSATLSDRIKVVKYDDNAQFCIGGTYSHVYYREFLPYATGRYGMEITVTDGKFTIPGNGYLMVTGGNSSTYVYMTWSDWTNGYEGSLQTYTESAISLASIRAMSEFENGLFQVGTYQDTIDFDLGVATSYIEQLSYSSENLAAAKASGRPYEYDTNYIYLVRETPISKSFNISNEYTASDHGIEFFETENGTIDDTHDLQPCYTTMLYGSNLAEYLKHDVPETFESQATEIQNKKVLLIDVPSFSALPQTVTSSKITSHMVVVWSMVSVRYAQASDWTVKTYDGYLTIEGTLATGASTSMRLVLAEYRA